MSNVVETLLHLCKKVTLPTMFNNNIQVAFVSLLYVCSVYGDDVMYSENSTVIKTRNVTLPGRIIVKEVRKPHNLFVGRCTKKYPVLHQENIFVNNDGQSQISANIRMNVEGPVYITCVNVYDEDSEIQAYPSYSAGGVGHNFVEFNVLTSFGKGFKFFVQIFGYKLNT